MSIKTLLRSRETGIFKSSNNRRDAVNANVIAFKRNEEILASLAQRYE